MTIMIVITMSTLHCCSTGQGCETRKSKKTRKMGARWFQPFSAMFLSHHANVDRGHRGVGSIYQGLSIVIPTSVGSEDRAAASRRMSAKT